MEQYDKVLEHILIVSLKINLIAIGIFVVALLIGLFFKNIKGRNKIIAVSLILIVGTLVEFGIFEIPRAIDLKTKEYITVENVDLRIEEMNDIDGSFLEYGYGYVTESNGKTYTVNGSLIIGLPSDHSSCQYFHGTIVYAKHSKQIVDFIIYD